MSGSSFGNIFKISTWGESHGPGVGVVIDGCPAGIPLCEEDIQFFLDRRKPGQSKFTTQRKESDRVVIQSGVFNGVTTGAPISLVVYNEQQRSRDYSEIANVYRPGHADYTFDKKFGIRDYRGGGRSSGRETIGRVAAGAIACKILSELGISFFTYSKSIGPVTIAASVNELLTLDKKTLLDKISNNSLYMPDEDAFSKAQAFLSECISKTNSSGGVIECIVTGVKPGLGDPVFDKLDANLAKGIFSIGAVKGFEIGDGFLAASSDGLTNNDSFYLGSDKTVYKNTNHSGGILGGISDGSPIVFRAAIKPTPSIALTQKTVNTSLEEVEINIKGRHDPIIVPRAVVVVESMAALVILDLLLSEMSDKISSVKDFYQSL